VLARIPEEELAQLMRGHGYRPIYVSGDDQDGSQQLAGALDGALDLHRRDPARRPNHPPERPTHLAHDRPADPEGLDRPEGCRRPARGGYVPGPSGAAVRPAPQARASAATRGVDAQLPARGAVRRVRSAGRGHPRVGAGRRAPDERHATRTEGAASRPGPPGHRRPRRRRGGARAEPARQPGHSAVTCGTSSRPTRARSGCSGPTRRPPTGCPTCSGDRPRMRELETRPGDDHRRPTAAC
jgi:hypothetical protein